MKKGDKVLWDNDFNYLPAVFISKDKFFDIMILEFYSDTPAANKHEVISLDVYPYTKEKHKELIEKYEK
jgi:hypothetical protein